MTGKGDNNDPLFDKLDNLMQSGRARKSHGPPPLLTDAVPAADESAIPTLTDAIEPPEPSATPEPEPEPEPEPGLTLDLEPLSAEPKAEPEPAGDSATTDYADPRTVISSRLVAAMDREMGKFAQELPVHRSRLAVLHRSLRFALPELVRLRWEDITEPESPHEDDAGASPDQ